MTRPFLPEMKSDHFKRALEDELDKREETKSRIGAVRPTDWPLGEYFFDTTITKPIWASSADAGVITWVDATGTTV